MLDFDLAKIYQVETKALNQAVKRNYRRFEGEEFMFQLTKGEWEIITKEGSSSIDTNANTSSFTDGYNLRSQIVTSRFSDKWGGNRRPPYAFSEIGVAMLSTILKSKVAVQTSIRIMDAFVEMRHYITNKEYRLLNIEAKIVEHDSEIKLLQESFQKFEEKKKVNEIYYKGQIYDAYSKIKDIFCLAKKELVIIDSYADKTVLDMIKSIKAKVLLITKENNKLTELDIEKYNKQYSNLKVIRNKNFHDRYFIIDKEEVYHCGTSINYAGSKIFSINTLEDNIIKESIIEVIEKIGKKVQ